MGAERARDGELPLPLRRPHQEERPHVHAQHHHEQQAREAEGHQRGPHAVHQVVLEAGPSKAEPLPLEVAAVHQLSHGVHGRHHRGGRRSGPGADQRPELAVAGVRRGEIDFKGGVGVRPLRGGGGRVPHEAEAGAHHADHPVRLAAQPHFPADHAPVGGELVAPEIVTQHDGPGAPRAILVGREATPQRGVHPQEREEPRRGQKDGDLAGLGPLHTGQGGLVALQGHRALHDTLHLGELRDVGTGEPSPVHPDPRVVAPYVVQVVRLAVGEGCQEHPVHHRVHGGERSQPHRQQPHHGQHEHRRAREAAHHALRVLPEAAVAGPRHRGAHPLAQSVAQRIGQRAHPHPRQRGGPAPPERGAAAVAVSLAHRAAHLLAEVGRV